MSVPNPKRKCMTLEERVKCLKLLESGKSSRVVASEMCVGRTQVQNVLKRKREIMDEYESNGNLTLKRPKRETEYSELNDLVYRWFLDATARLVNVSGPMIQEKARNFARDLGCNEFKGSNGWLECFVKRNNIVFKTQVGERGEVSSASVKQWKEIIPEVCQGYAPENIFNMDETGLFYRDTTKSTYFKKGESCSGGKRSKQRITLALCASMTDVCVFFSFTVGSMGCPILRQVRETCSPPCCYHGEQCSTVFNQPITNENTTRSLRSINEKRIGAINIAEDTIKSDIEDRWGIVLAEREDIPVETANEMEQYTTYDPSNFCNNMRNIYEHLNELTYNIEYLSHYEGGVLNSGLEANMKTSFTDWQEEIYLCMCELKQLLRSFNCESCSAVPSGHLLSYVQTVSGSIPDQQKAAYCVVLTGINRLRSIQTYLQLAIQDVPILVANTQSTLSRGTAQL